MAAKVFSIRPEDGWVPVTDAGTDFVKIRSITSRHPIFVTSGAEAPAANAPGYKVGCHEHFLVNVTTTDLYYVRTVDEQPEGNKIAVFALNTPVTP